MPEDEKLWEAMEEDERIVQDTIEKLTVYSSRRICIKIKDPANANDHVEVHSRRLKQSEILEYNRRLREINPKLPTLKDPASMVLTEEEDQKILDLQDEFIERATKIPRDKLKDDISPKIKLAILIGVLKASTPSEEDVQSIEKFRQLP